jgi:hypothetical protein
MAMTWRRAFKLNPNPSRYAIGLICPPGMIVRAAGLLAHGSAQPRDGHGSSPPVEAFVRW